MTIDKAWAPQTITVFDSLIAAPPPAAAKKSGRKTAAAQPADLVSVCVTVYNYARFLTDCLDSLKSQTHPALDVVIIDDASQKDDSVEVARAWAEENAESFYRLRVYTHCRNQGPAEARNTAFRNALGEYVFIIDADNEIYPRAIARLYEAALAAQVEATYCQIEKYGEQRAIGEADIWDVAAMHRNNYVDIMALIKHSAWRAIDGFTHIEDGWEDYDFWLKFIDAGFTAAYVPEILSRYRVHGLSRTATEAHAAHEDLRALMAFRHVGFNIEPEVSELEAAAALAPEPVAPGPVAAVPVAAAIPAAEDASLI
jgi:glycosyltransferase involved in cell wall biosynthesis